MKKYNKNLYFNYSKNYTTKELIYLCGVYETDKCKDISIALGRTVKSIYQKIFELKKEELFDYYKNLYRKGC